MTKQNSAGNTKYRPETLVEKYGIKSTAYYRRTKFLKIQTQKDENNKVYLTSEQVEMMDALNEHIKATGKMQGFEFSSGGLELKVTQLLGLKEGTQRVYNQSAGNNHVWVQIEGARASDRTPINKRYFVLGQSGASYVVMDGEGIYKTGEQRVGFRSSTQPTIFR